MKVAFIHPDLGIGGAERLVVDGALALQNKGHDVIIYTSHHDPKHAFDETRDGTLKVKVLGDTLFPRNLLGKFAILCAISRQLHLTAGLQNEPDADVYIVDQLSAAVPYIRYLKPNARILFYCHHPDLKLTERKNVVKKLYRIPFDEFERWSTAKSDQIAVNSEYTRKVFFESFGKQMPDPTVLYPVVDPSAVVLGESKLAKASADPEFKKMTEKIGKYFNFERKMLLSINRFERKKDIELAIDSYSTVLHARTDLREDCLIVAGGYDLRVKENLEYLQELQKLCDRYRVPHATKFPQDSWSTVNFEKSRVLFLPSVSGVEKSFLLEQASLLLYTPTNEHFGIVPLESMVAETPVLATNTGGPLETIVDGETGFLRKPDVEDWYSVIVNVLGKMDPQQLKAMGKLGRKKVEDEFTLKNMEFLLNNLVLKTKETERKNEEKVTQNTFWVTFGISMSSVLLFLLAWLIVEVLCVVLPFLRDSLYWQLA